MIIIIKKKNRYITIYPPVVILKMLKKLQMKKMIPEN